MRIRIHDPQGKLLGIAEGDFQAEGKWEGSLIENHFSEKQQDILNQFAHSVEQQIFSLLDEMEAGILKLGLESPELEGKIRDFQLFEDKVSFRLA